MKTEKKEAVKKVVAKVAAPKVVAPKVKAVTVSLQSELVRIQKDIKAPKNQTNTHANFKFRSAEDICEGYKKVAGSTSLIIRDEIILIGERFYVKATAILMFEGESLSVSAFAREAEKFPQMNEAQSTGSASSYARKYALNGLFAIDDTKDADANPEEMAKDDAKKSILEEHEIAIGMIDDVERLKEYWLENQDKGLGKVFAQMVTRRKAKLSADIIQD